MRRGKTKNKLLTIFLLIFSLVLLLCVNLALGITKNEPLNMINWGEYGRFNYEVKYPIDWMTFDIDIVNTLHCVEIHKKYPDPLLRIIVFDNPKRFTAIEWHVKTIEGRRVCNNIEIDKQNGIEYKTFHDFHIIPTKVVYVTNILVPKNDKMYLIQFEVLNNNIENQELFKAILSTFHFIK